MKIQRIPFIAAVATFLIHLVANPHYGFFRDELYFIICGQHPAFGYVDQPPVIPLLAAGSQLFGHSLVMLRALPALFAAAGVYVGCLLVIEFEGGVYAQAIAALAIFFCPVLQSFGMKISTDMVGLWLWPLAALYVVRIVKGADPRLWLAVGGIIGICLESKYSVVFFAVAAIAGLLITPERRVLMSRWYFAGIAIALAIAAPNFIWQAQHGFPMWELLEAGQHGKNLIAGPGLYLLQQLLITDVLLAPIWIIGLVRFFRDARFRFLGYAYVILIGLMIVMHGKHYYPACIYTMLLAGGAVSLEAWTKRFAIARIAVATAVVAFGLVFLPFDLPVLGETQLIAYVGAVENAMHISKGTLATEHQKATALPSDYADMHGWPELAATVRRAYVSLPPSERAQTVVYAQNYGEASAIAFFAPGVPVVSGHNQYWLWGLGTHTGTVMIDLNGHCFHDYHVYARARTLATFANPYGQAYEQKMPIMLCTGDLKSLASAWPAVKTYE